MDVNGSLLVLLVAGLLLVKEKETTNIVYVPSYLEVELKGTLTFNISWQADEDATLTVAQVIGSVDTQVLSVNGTYADFFNNWADKGEADILNETEASFTLALTLDNIVLEDEGQYKAQLETIHSSSDVYFTVQTYALPIYLQITSDSMNYTELSDALFTCTGNVGRPLGILRLLRSAASSNTNHFIVEEYITAEDLSEHVGSAAVLPNGTYYLTYTFYRNMVRQDNGTLFMCDYVPNVPSVTTKASNQIAVLVDFESVSMTVTPTKLTLRYTGQGQDPKTTFRCDGISASNIDRFTDLRIQRLTQREKNTNQHRTIATIYSDEPASIPQVAETDDIQIRAELSGTVDKLDFPRSYLQLEMETSAIQCDDAGEYVCLFRYNDIAGTSYTMESSMNLTVTALPSDIELSANPKIFPQNGDGTSTRPYVMKMGEEIEFTCTGNIGSNRNLQFEWWKTGNTGTSVIKFRPEVQPNADETRGEVNPLPAQCTNSRSTTMKYNISLTDRGSILFMCFAQDTTTLSGSYYTVNSTTAIYIDIGGTNGGGGEPGGSTDNEVAGASAGVIAGAVIGAIAFIVIVVLLVYFLWYRRRGGGDTYTTREVTDGSNPNLAPSAADLYATPTKDRNKHGHENRGMDDHEANHLRKGHKDRDYDRRRYDDDYDHKGHHNYALDDDFESRDGSPSVQHMSDGPIGTGV